MSTVANGSSRLRNFARLCEELRSDRPVLGIFLTGSSLNLRGSGSIRDFDVNVTLLCCFFLLFLGLGDWSGGRRAGDDALDDGGRCGGGHSGGRDASETTRATREEVTKCGGGLRVRG